MFARLLDAVAPELVGRTREAHDIAHRVEHELLHGVRRLVRAHERL